MIDRRTRLEREQPLDAVQRDVLARIARLIVRGESMLEASDRWLRDPEDPERYDLSPRGYELPVVYDSTDDAGRPCRRKATLGELVRRVEDGLGITVVSVESRAADPRKLLLDAVTTLKPVLELLGKATGQIRPDVSTGGGGSVTVVLGLSAGAGGSDLPPAARRPPIEVRAVRED